MKTIKSIIAMALVAVSTTVSFAQEKENHRSGEPGMGPHKGIIQEAPPYHIELLNKDGKLSIYLLDGHAKPMKNKGITGTIILQFADKTSSTGTLTPVGEDGFTLANEKASSFTTCVVTFKVDGKTATSKFKAASAKSYTCSMCGGTFDKEGKCPKCGMDLIEKKAGHTHKEGENHQH